MEKIIELTQKLKELKVTNEKVKEIKSLLLDTNGDVVVQVKGKGQLTFNKELTVDQIINELLG